MSWISSFFSNLIPPPADSIRQPRRLLEEPISTKESSIEQPTLTKQAIDDYEAQQEKGRRRNRIMTVAGLAFMGVSILVTRRSMTRRRLASQAAFYSDAPAHSADQAKKVSGALEAVEALNLATVNVLSVALTATGAGLWYLDINTLQDARRMIRGGLGVDGTGKTEEEANEEIEEVIASILARKDEKQNRR